MLTPREELSAALSDRYEILAEIGRGGFATVFEARDLRHNSKVAIKALRPELAAALGAQRFSQEVQITARLQHPNILPLLDSGTANGLPWYVMPLVEGESVAVRLQRERQLDIGEAVQLAAEVADGLAHAHAQGFVHRDIKPDNILLSHGHAILSDFGIARALDVTGSERLTDSGIALGTVSYMSPEQAAGDRVDGRADVYALGCVLYETLTGAPPFSGPTAQTIMARHAVDPPPGIRSVRPTVSPRLEAAVLRALAKAPADRFQSAKEFRDEIRAAVTDQTNPSLTSPTARSFSYRAVAAGAGIVAVLGAGALWLTTRQPDVALDANRVIVFPLVLPDGWEGSKTTGEDVATMIGSLLDGAGPVRWVDGWQQLSPSQRENIRLLTDDEAREIARSQRARFSLSGRIFARGDTADVTLTLHDTQGDSAVAQQRATALASEVWRGGLAATTRLLPRLIPTAIADAASEWSARSPAAVAPFLLGEQAFRRAQLSEAQRHFALAVANDSGFGLAAIRGAQAASWNHDQGAAARLIDVALRGNLSPHHQAFAIGYRHFLQGSADSSAAWLRQALAFDSTRAFIWMQLGEVYAHLHPLGGNTDSLEADALERAMKLDSTSANALYHLIEVRLRAGDTLRAAPLVRAFLAARPDTLLATEVRLMDTCVRRGPHVAEWSEAARAQPQGLLGAASSLMPGGKYWGCAAAAFEALLGSDTAATNEADARRWAAVSGLQGILLARGDSGAAVRTIESFVQRWSVGKSLYLWNASNLGLMASRSAPVVLEDTARFGPTAPGCEFATRCWLIGGLLVNAGQHDKALTLAREIAQLPNDPASVSSAGLALSIEARVALARRDTAGATAKLRRLLLLPRNGPTYWWDNAGSFGAERMLLARVMLARGEYREALEISQVFDSRSIVFAPFVPASLALREQAASKMGNSVMAASLRARQTSLTTSQ